MSHFSSQSRAAAIRLRAAEPAMRNPSCRTFTEIGQRFGLPTDTVKTYSYRDLARLLRRSLDRQSP